MGNWKLEIFKMTVYIGFPVTLFYCFNQPAFFESWLMEKRKLLFPQDLLSDREQYENVKKVMEEKRIAEWEKMTTK